MRQISRVFLFLSFLQVGASALAAVPYVQLENLRRQSVVVRVALDEPDNATLRECGVGKESFAVLGGGLSAAMDQAAGSWSKIMVTSTDLPTLKSRVAGCKERGSCQVYDKFLSSAKSEKDIAPQIKEMTSSLQKTLESLDASSYQRALKTVPSPCKILKSIETTKTPEA
jgi:hypothetical protein